ncbi:MAG: hypothetical protein J2P37_30905, partial [Ktedonobacteraceae bacterium]|nr:hypothetical protein [Ktedonobacteraceae bacterium]
MITGSVFRYADAAQAIPNILLALVAAQFSMLIIVIFLNFNNTLSVSMYTWANTNQAFAPEKTHIVVSCKPDGTDCTNWDDDIFNIFSNFNKLDEGFIGTIKDYMFGSITNFMKLLFGFSMIGLLAQMLTRMLILNLYIVTSPIGLASWALPGRVGRPLTNSWLRGFISTVLVQFVQVMGLIVARGTLGLLSKTFSQALGSSPDETLKWIIGTVLIWFVIRIPSLLGTAPMGMMVQVAQNMSRTAGAAVAHEVATVRMITSFVGAGAGIGVIAAVR